MKTGTFVVVKLSSISLKCTTNVRNRGANGRSCRSQGTRTVQLRLQDRPLSVHFQLQSQFYEAAVKSFHYNSVS